MMVFESVCDQRTFAAGCLSALTKTPDNVIIKKGDDVYMECATDSTSITPLWNHDVYAATKLPCTSVDPTRYLVSAPVPQSDCFITALGNATAGNQGVYGCNDGSGTVAEAVAVLIGA